MSISSITVSARLRGPPPVGHRIRSFIISMTYDGTRPYAWFWISSFLARKEDWTP
ncbi:hypothetical protein EDD85DRAFT_954604 [Armillaria nabsnona]|nr:hypothetical protein EDD85DRAFT_954604 [Armillaria nabsnona]